MDNTVVPYDDSSSGSDENESSSDDEHSQLLSSNIGVLHNNFETKNVKFMNMESAEQYQMKRNQLFTPEIQKRYFTVSLISNTDDQPFSLKDTIKLPTDNIIGFKMIKSNFVGNNSDNHVDLTISEIPEISCDKDEGGNSIFARIPLRKTNTEFYTHQFLELSLIDRYFYPTSFNMLTFKLSTAVSGFVVIEISYLNQSSLQ
tara:strand:+ start:2857 stop:3462 length:606 start_codon:yes stop_codon:yes gene_type:complete